jgi:hypothetical protein
LTVIKSSQSPLYGPRRALRQHRLADQVYGLCLPAFPEILDELETTLDAGRFRLQLWDPGSRGVTEGSHYALRVRTDQGWRPWHPGRELQEGDTVIRCRQPRYLVRRLMHEQDDPIRLRFTDGYWRCEI